MYPLIAAVGFYLVIGLVFWRFGLLKRRYLEPMFMWIMLLGIAFLCQPWFLVLYTYGYAVLLTGTAAYIFSIHLK